MFLKWWLLKKNLYAVSIAMVNIIPGQKTPKLELLFPLTKVFTTALWHQLKLEIIHLASWGIMLVNTHCSLLFACSCYWYVKRRSSWQLIMHHITSLGQRLHTRHTPKPMKTQAYVIKLRTIQSIKIMPSHTAEAITQVNFLNFPNVFLVSKV